MHVKHTYKKYMKNVKLLIVDICEFLESLIID